MCVFVLYFLFLYFFLPRNKFVPIFTKIDRRFSKYLHIQK